MLKSGPKLAVAPFWKRAPVTATVTVAPRLPPDGLQALTAGGRVTVVTAVARLLTVFGSLSLAETVAVLVRVPAAPGVTTSVTVALAPPASEPSVQATALPPVQLISADETDLNATVGGSVSLSVTLVAGPGPPLLTVRV